MENTEKLTPEIKGLYEVASLNELLKLYDEYGEAFLHGIRKENIIVPDGIANVCEQETGITFLMYTVLQNYLDTFKVLLDTNPDIDKKCYDGATALLYAVGCGNVECTKLLLERGADKELREKNGFTALMTACGRGQYEIAKILLDDGADIHCSSNGYTPLFIAAGKGHLEVVKLLHEYGADINTHDNDGTSALFFSIDLKFYDIAKFLLEKGANVNLKNMQDTPLIILAVLRDYALTQLVIQHGVDINARHKETGATALIFACAHGYADRVELLIAHDADVNLQDNAGTNALNQALQYPEILKLLLKAGAQPCSKEGRTLLIEAICEQQLESIQLLLDHTSLINKKGKDGYTPLMIAVAVDNIEITQLLLAKGALVDEQNDAFQSALYIAIKLDALEQVRILLAHGAEVNHAIYMFAPLTQAIAKNSLAIVQLLIAHGANINMLGSKGDSYLMVAAFNGWLEMVKLLVKAGADKEIISQGFTAELLAKVKEHSEIVAYFESLKNEDMLYQQ